MRKEETSFFHLMLRRTMSKLTTTANNSNNIAPTTTIAGTTGTALPAVMSTHRVFNQAPILENFNAYLSNRRMRECVEHYCAGSLTVENKPGESSNTTTTSSVLERLELFGRVVGDARWIERARLANEYTPIFTPFDRQGRRIDSVTFHDSYHDLMGLAVSCQVPNFSYNNPTSPHQTTRAALQSLYYQLDQGTSCPLTMAYSAVPPLAGKANAGRFDEWVAKLKVPVYDERDLHISMKQGVLCGMSMTEKQGGSDVRSNETVAVRAPGDNADEIYYLTGHKWFTSAPMCDGFLTLANTHTGKGGASTCFLVPRWVSPEQRNLGLRFQRLKTKLGDKSNASSEVEYHQAVGYRVGEEGKGIRTIIEMVNHTRLDCMLGSAGMMQCALFHAVNVANHRTAFGGRLIDKPLMQNVLCDLALETEACTALAMRVAHSFNAQSSISDLYRRLVCAVGKYYVCKRAPAVLMECLESMGGNGFVEDFPMARMYRQAPLNAVWEGSGNVIVLDVFRALQQSDGKEVAAMLMKEVEPTNSPVLKKELQDILSVFSQFGGGKMSDDAAILMQGRQLVERLALVMMACALVHCGPKKELVFEPFVQSRIAQRHGVQFGTMDPSVSRCWSGIFR